MADEAAITRDDLERLVSNRIDRCETCSKHEAHEARIARLEQQQDSTVRDMKKMTDAIANLRTDVQTQMGEVKAEMAKTKTQIAAIVLISSPVWTAIVGAIVYFVARG